PAGKHQSARGRLYFDGYDYVTCRTHGVSWLPSSDHGLFQRRYLFPSGKLSISDFARICFADRRIFCLAAYILCSGCGYCHCLAHRWASISNRYHVKGAAMITLENVTKTYSGETTIGPIDLEITSGGMTSLVGPNGSGKSTVLTMMGRLLTPDSGKITVGGLDVANAKSNDVAKKLAILRQENHFVTRLTV